MGTLEALLGLSSSLFKLSWGSFELSGGILGLSWGFHGRPKAQVFGTVAASLRSYQCIYECTHEFLVFDGMALVLVLHSRHDTT